MIDATTINVLDSRTMKETDNGCTYDTVVDTLHVESKTMHYGKGMWMYGVLFCTVISIMQI